MASEAQTLIGRLLASQNPDGGWPYQTGTSWAEPTGFALLALHSQQDSSFDPVLNRGSNWLLAAQKSSGGWTPNAAVDECTSVTSVATLALLNISQRDLSAKLTAAIKMTASQVYADDFSLSLLLARTLHLPPPHAPGSVPWYPGTAGWVIPTALTSLALLRAADVAQRPALRETAAECCAYLLSRRCVDSGWNHGGSKTRSEDATSYPETTGLALLALRAAAVDPPAPSVALAKQFASNPESVEGLAWIQLALNSPAKQIPDPAVMPSPRTTRDASLRLLSLAAANGSNIFVAT